jgi:hypothetical protein
VVWYGSWLGESQADIQKTVDYPFDFKLKKLVLSRLAQKASKSFSILAKLALTDFQMSR